VSEPAHILVVDDEPKNHKILERLLTAKYQVHCVDSGEQCLSSLETLDADLILLDIMMPDLDGYEVCRRIRSRDATRNLPVVFVSAKDSLEDRLMGYEVGADDYFIKPFDHQELLVKIDRLLASKKHSDALSERVAQANSIAFQAMTNTSKLGEILNFLQASFTAETYQQLATTLLNTTQSFGWSCALQIRDPNQTLNFSDKGSVSPLEESIIERVRGKGRIFDFNRRSVFTYENVSLLIKNMPVDDAELYGQEKDNACLLLNGTQARIKALLAESDRQRKQHYLVEMISHTNELMEKINLSYAGLRGESYAIVEDMMDKLNELVPRLGLEEYQETSILDIAEACVARTREMYDKGIIFDHTFAHLIKQLTRVVSNGDTESIQFKQLIARLR